MKHTKRLGRKAYGSIGHLPFSRMGPGDHAITNGQARICCERLRDKHDRITVQEKLDGSCVAVALIDGTLHALGRAGWPVVSSPYQQHRMFHDWAMLNAERFFSVLKEGERIVGEWLAQAHGTRYDLPHEPFVAFDIMVETTRMPFEEAEARIGDVFKMPTVLHRQGSSLPIAEAIRRLGHYGYHGAKDQCEGVVYRVERRGKVDFLAKYVRPDKVDGNYLPEISGSEAVWNWIPKHESEATA